MTISIGSDMFYDIFTIYRYRFYYHSYIIIHRYGSLKQITDQHMSVSHASILHKNSAMVSVYHIRPVAFSNITFGSVFSRTWGQVLPSGFKSLGPSDTILCLRYLLTFSQVVADVL